MELLRRYTHSCATCGKEAGVFTCRGCSQNFCLPHTNDHRRALETRMQEIILTHNRLKQAITEQTTEQFHPSLMQQIEQWEQQSIDKIQQVANDIRQQLLSIVRDRTDNLKEKVVQLSQQLNKAQHDGEFFENDLQQWSDKLDKFRQQFIRQQRIKIHYDKNSVPFISKISIYDLSDDDFLKPWNDIQYGIEHEKITENEYEDYSNVKEKGEYSVGQHSFRFKLDPYETSSSVLFGVVSKIVHERRDSYKNPSLYGWSENNTVYLAGEKYRNYYGYKSDFRAGDIIMLTIDCIRETISLTNERTHDINYLDIDTTHCPLPWVPYVTFFNDKE